MPLRAWSTGTVRGRPRIGALGKFIALTHRGRRRNALSSFIVATFLVAFIGLASALLPVASFVSGPIVGGSGHASAGAPTAVAPARLQRQQPWPPLESAVARKPGDWGGVGAVVVAALPLPVPAEEGLVPVGDTRPLSVLEDGMDFESKVRLVGKLFASAVLNGDFVQAWNVLTDSVGEAKDRLWSGIVDEQEFPWEETGIVFFSIAALANVAVALTFFIDSLIGYRTPAEQVKEREGPAARGRKRGAAERGMAQAQTGLSQGDLSLPPKEGVEVVEARVPDVSLLEKAAEEDETRYEKNKKFYQDVVGKPARERRKNAAAFLNALDKAPDPEPPKA